MRNYKELKVWEKAHQCTLEVYKLSNSFPDDEKFGIIAQIKRAVASVPTNIAEGCGHTSNKEFKRYLGIALASATEVEYLLQLSYDLSFCEQEQYLQLNNKVIEVKKMLHGFINSIS